MTGRKKVILYGALGVLATVATGFQLDRLRYEEPEYERVSVYDDFEVRQYGPRIVAETAIDGEADAATSEGFRRLAGYIFGGNDGGASIDMTTLASTPPRLTWRRR